MPEHLPFVLAAAELVDLACRRRVEAVDGRIRVVEELRTGDPVLDATLARLAARRTRPEIDEWIRWSAADRVQAHIAALLESGELSGRLISIRLDEPPQPMGLRIADPRRRAALAERLVNITRTDLELDDEAFGALAQAAGLPALVLSGLTKYRVAKYLKGLAGWFADTWRYLPGCPDELALGDADVEPGGVNPARDEPQRLLIRLAVQQAVKLCVAKTRKTWQAQIAEFTATAVFLDSM